MTQSAGAIVVDASAAVDLVLGQPWTQPMRDRMRHSERMHVPAIWPVECLSALRGLVLGGNLDEGRALTARNSLAEMRVRQWDIDSLADRIWSLRHNMSAYDANYVALAELLDGALATGDSRLAKAVRAASAIEVIELTP